MEVLTSLVRQVVTAKRLTDHNTDEIPSIQSTISEKKTAQKSNQNTSAGIQPQTQSTFVNKKPNVYNTEATESISPIEASRILIPKSSVLIPGFTIPLQVPIKTIRSISDIHIDPNTSEKFASQKLHPM